MIENIREKLRRVAQDKDVDDKKGTQPKKYYSGVDKDKKSARDAHFKKGAEMDDDNPNAYKPAPGDKDPKTGELKKTKPSKHTQKFKKMFGENYDGDMAQNSLENIVRNANNLKRVVKEDGDYPAWWNSKLTKADDYLDVCHDYLMSELSQSEQIDEELKSSDRSYLEKRVKMLDQLQDKIIRMKIDDRDLKQKANKQVGLAKYALDDLLDADEMSEDLEENAPNTADAMKRYKAGKAGFTDKAHLKAKGMIPRADGTKKVSDKYKEELEATNAKLDVLKGFMSKLDSFENALTEATEPKVMKEVQEKIIYREFNPADNRPKVVWRKPVVKEVEQPAMQEDFVSKIAGMMTKDIHAQKAAGLNEQEEKSALETLREEFRSFKQNVISQLASLGGGGAGKLVDLDDVDISSLGNGKFLVYNSSTAKLEFTDQVDGN